MQDTPSEAGYSPAPALAPSQDLTSKAMQIPSQKLNKPSCDTKDDNRAKDNQNMEVDKPSENTNKTNPAVDQTSHSEAGAKETDNSYGEIFGSNGDTRYGCPVCDMVLFSSHDFTIHIRSHKPEDLGFISSSGKGFVCQICGKVLTSVASLDKHILTHSGEQKFKCKVCSISFTTIGNLHRHMRTHNNPENGDCFNYDSDASAESLGSPKTLSTLPLTFKKRRVSRTASEYNNNVIEFSPSFISDINSKRKVEDDFSTSKRKKSEKNNFAEKFDCSFCGKTGFLSLNLLETHIEECHPDYQAKCIPCNLVFKNHRVLNLHRYMVHHSELKERALGNSKETIGFKDLTFVDFSSEKFPHIARAMCEQSLHLASSLFHRFQCEKCGRAFPCGSALNIHRQGCGQENYASSGESCHQDNDFSSSDEAPTDLSSTGKRSSWGETKISESSDDVEDERKRYNFFAGLDLQNKSVVNTSPQYCPPVTQNVRRESYLNHNNPEGKDLADIQSIISVTSAGGLLHDLSKSPQPTVLEVTPPDSGSRIGTFESTTDEEQQDCFAAEFRKMKLRGEFPCRLCTAIFPNLRALKGHNRVHLTNNNGQNPVPYRCNMCPHFSSDKSALIRHMRTHNGDRPYECALCHYAFTTKANCERHLRNRHAKMTREEVKKSIIYHPSEDPTNDTDHKPNRDDVKRSLFSESDHLNLIESKESFKTEKSHSFPKQILEKPIGVFETVNIPKSSPFASVQKIVNSKDIAVNGHAQRKCLDVGTMTYEECDVGISEYQENITPEKTDSDADAPLDLSMDVLDLSKKKTIPKEQPVVSKKELYSSIEDLEPQDLSKKSNFSVDKLTSPANESLEKNVIHTNFPLKPEDDLKISTPSPHPSYESESPVPPNPITKLDLSKLYPVNAHPFYLNANAPFPSFPAATSLPNGPYPPYFIPPPPPVLFPANPSHDFVEMKERLQKELIRGLQLTSGGSLVLDQLAMANAADRIQSLHQQAMAEFSWRIESAKEERTFSPALTKENISVHSESEQDPRNQEVNQSKLQEKLVLSKPKPETSSSVKMVIKNGVLIPKQKQRRYRTERPFSCEHCSARFTLRSNMERHIKQQHPQYWTQRQRNAITMPARRNHSVSSKVPQNILNHSQFYSHTGVPNMGIKSEEETSKSSINSDQTTTENKFSISEGKPCISEEVKNAIALQLRSKISTSDAPVNENDNSELIEEEEDEDLVIDEGVKDEEVEDKNADKNIEEEISFRKKMSMKEDNADLASVSRLLDNASTQTFRQYFHAEEDHPGGEVSEEDEEGLVAAGSASEGCNSGSDENRSESENNGGSNPQVVKKKSAYSLAPNRVSCPYCFRKFPWSSSLRRHVLTHTGQKPYKCSFCPLLFTTKSNCDRHLLRKHGGGTPAATSEVPAAVASEQSNGPNYTMRNVPERPYKCKNCPSSTFSTLSNLKKHLSTKHQSPGSYKNEGTQSGYESQGSVSEEIDVGENEMKNEQEEYKEKHPITDLREIHPGHSSESNHVFKTHHPPEQTFVAVQPSDLPFKCHLCEGSFAERQEALDHIRDNHCSEFQLLVSKGALEVGAASEENHPSEENGEENLEQLRGKFPDYANRKVMCAFCLRRFWSAEDLRRHMRTHTGERPFSCDICRRRFTLKHSMLRHRKKHSFPAPEDNSPASDEDVTPNNNNNTVPAKPWTRSRLEEESDLISNLLGIQDKTIVDQMLLSKSADDAAKLLGVQK